MIKVSSHHDAQDPCKRNPHPDELTKSQLLFVEQKSCQHKRRYDETVRHDESHIHRPAGPVHEERLHLDADDRQSQPYSRNIHIKHAAEKALLPQRRKEVDHKENDRYQ